MNMKCQKKNYYFLETIKREINKFNVISFDIFDTMIFRKLLFPQDILRETAQYAKNRYEIEEFNLTRTNAETELRNRMLQIDNSIEDISLAEIYGEIAAHHPEYVVDDLMKHEISDEERNAIPSPLVKELFDEALKDKKTVLLIADTCIPKPAMEALLKKCGFSGWTGLFLSGELKKQKATGSLYRYILEDMQIASNEWLHIGDDPMSDVSVPRSLGITVGFLRCPRDWFFMEREHIQAHKETEAGRPIAVSPLDSSLEFSRDTALDINDRFTRYILPEKETVISVKNVSMMFNMSSEKIDNLKEYVIRMLKRQLSFKKFWALNDISFDVRKGERIGLIGLNGSGKSTMLKVVSGVLKPTTGSVSVSGTIAPMIELGAGFDFELSARENVYLNGAILGHSHEQMDKYYDEIMDFAELEAFQDVSIKNFSSGMIARLGFAIATCWVPDILIIDEILSVGDFEFQKKCHKKMELLTGQGATVLFVSHSATDVINMCDRVIWLSRGNVIADGEAQYIVEKYLNV